MGSDNLLLSFQIKFDQIPAQNKEEDKKQNKDNDLHGRKKNVGYGGWRELLSLFDEVFERKKDNDKKDDDSTDNPGAFFTLDFGCFIFVAHFKKVLSYKSLKIPHAFLNKLFALIKRSFFLFEKLLYVFCRNDHIPSN